jgi:hypothetical protein
MTAPRHGAKAIALWLGLMGLLPSQPAAAEPPLVVNMTTGLALSGFDPVAYFTDARPELGRPDFELNAQGAVWRFRNPGNRAAFVAAPAAYTPAFGGYDPVAIGRDRSVPGHPLYWAMADERVYLFYSAENRDAFLAEPGRILMLATRKWPALEKSIGR